MIKKLLQNQWVKDETASWWSSLAKSPQYFFFYLLVLFLPTQFGKHFWPSWSYLYGQRIDYLSPTLYMTDILILVLFIFSLVKKQIQVTILFLLSILYLSVTVFLSQNPFFGWYSLLKFLEMSLLVNFVAKHFSFLNKKIVGFALAFGIIFESVLAMVQFYFQGSVGGFLYFIGERTFSGETPGIANAAIHGTLVLRPYATFSHPNVLAAFLLIGMLLVWYFLKEEKTTLQNFLLWTTVSVGAVGLILTLSRTTILLGIALGICLIAQKLQKKFIVLFVGALLILSFLFPTLLYRFAPSAFEESAAAREQLMHASLTMVAAHPFFGVGLGNFLSSLPSSSLLQPVHNIFLLWTSETGIIGIGILLFGLGFLLRKGVLFWQKSSKSEKQHLLPLLLVFVSIISLGTFDHYFLTLQQGQLILALSTGLLLGHLNK